MAKFKSLLILKYEKSLFLHTYFHADTLNAGMPGLLFFQPGNGLCTSKSIVYFVYRCTSFGDVEGIICNVEKTDAI